ncbi:MAG: hypothetical protein MUD02_08315 [Bacteroidales bacterium]|jgi:hypothetical protein|nr:hypothetical protein [Bacteroidales bacterium]
MKWLIRILFFCALVPAFSCEELTVLFDCMDCQDEEPYEGLVEIRIDPEFLFSNTINIYEGNLEDNILVSTTTAQNEIFSVSLGVNRKYTITATYNSGGKTYTAVDEVLPKVMDMKDRCGETCYKVYDNICRLRLKRI